MIDWVPRFVFGPWALILGQDHGSLHVLCIGFLLG